MIFRILNRLLMLVRVLKMMMMTTTMMTMTMMILMKMTKKKMLVLKNEKSIKVHSQNYCAPLFQRSILCLMRAKLKKNFGK